MKMTPEQMLIEIQKSQSQILKMQIAQGLKIEAIYQALVVVATQSEDSKPSQVVQLLEEILSKLNKK